MPLLEVTSHRGAPSEAHTRIVGPCLCSGPNKSNSVTGDRQVFFFPHRLYY